MDPVKKEDRKNRVDVIYCTERQPHILQMEIADEKQQMYDRKAVNI